MPSHPDRVRRNYPEGVPIYGAHPAVFEDQIRAAVALNRALAVPPDMAMNTTGMTREEIDQAWGKVWERREHEAANDPTDPAPGRAY